MKLLRSCIKLWIITVLLAVAAIPAAWAKTFDSEEFTLANGIRVIVVPNPKIPAVAHVILYKSGAIDEPPGKSGIAHFLEHLMFKGTTKIPAGKFSSTIAHNGGNDNAFTTHDYTAYFQAIAVDKLPMVMEMEADRMQNLLLNKPAVESERQVIIEERRMRTDNSPHDLLIEQMNAALFLNHPYGRPVIGWKHEMEGLSQEDALAFYHAHYAPNNAILVVAGDVTAATVKPLAEKIYGAIPKREVPAEISLREPPAIAARRVELADKRVKNREWVRFYNVTSIKDNEKEGVALDVMAHILGGTDSSRLYQRLVVEKQMATAASAYYDGMTKGPSRLQILVIPKEGVSFAAIETEVESLLAELQQKGITAEELSRTVHFMHADMVYGKESYQNLAFAFAEVAATGVPIQFLENADENLAAVTLENVQQAAVRALQKPHSVTGLLYAEEAAQQPAQTIAKKEPGSTVEDAAPVPSLQQEQGAR